MFWLSSNVKDCQGKATRQAASPGGSSTLWTMVFLVKKKYVSHSKNHSNGIIYLLFYLCQMFKSGTAPVLPVTVALGSLGHRFPSSLPKWIATRGTHHPDDGLRLVALRTWIRRAWPRSQGSESTWHPDRTVVSQPEAQHLPAIAPTQKYSFLSQKKTTNVIDVQTETPGPDLQPADRILYPRMCTRHTRKGVKFNVR